MTWRSELLIKGTSGPGRGVTNGQILAFLEEWSGRAELTVSDVAGDGLTLSFRSLPVDVEALVAAIHRVCPDAVDRDFGCIDEILDDCAHRGIEPPAELLELVEGLDLTDRRYGLVALERALRRDRVIRLRWA